MNRLTIAARVLYARLRGRPLHVVVMDEDPDPGSIVLILTRQQAASLLQGCRMTGDRQAGLDLEELLGK